MKFETSSTIVFRVLLFIMFAVTKQFYFWRKQMIQKFQGAQREDKKKKRSDWLEGWWLAVVAAAAAKIGGCKVKKAAIMRCFLLLNQKIKKCSLLECHDQPQLQQLHLYLLYICKTMYVD